MKCCDLTTGMLTERVTIERLVTERDVYGGLTQTWLADPATRIPAHLKALSGTEAFEAMRTSPRLTVNVFIRFRGDSFGAPYYTPADRLIHRNRYFNILAVQDVDFEGRWLKLLVNEGDPS